MAKPQEQFLADIRQSMTDREEPSRPAARSDTEQRNRNRKRLEGAALIGIERIAPDPNQPRTEFNPESLQRLAASLKGRGQLQPIRVRWEPASDLYRIVVGERRWQAAKLAGIPVLACIEVQANATAEEILEDQLVENCLREDLRPIEQARAFAALLNRLQIGQRELAERLDVPQASISRALALLTLPEDVQDQVDAGEIVPATAYEISKVEDPEEQARLAEDAAAGNLTVKEASTIARKTASRPKKSRGDRMQPWTFETPDGRLRVTVVALKDGTTEDEVTEALKKALSLRRKPSGGSGKAA